MNRTSEVTVDRPVRWLIHQYPRAVEAIGPGDRVINAVNRMNACHIGSVLVLTPQIVGIITERDIMTRVVAAGRDPCEITVDEVMTTPVIVISTETTIGASMDIMTRNRCRHLPVIDGDGDLAGLISIGDLTAAMVREQRHRIDDLIAYISS